MRVPYHLNSKTYDVAPCPKCGGTEIDFDAGMLAGAITCRHCKYRVVHNDIFDALRKWGCEGLPLTKDEEIKQLREAIGLLTTLHPAMEMDVKNPLEMAKKIERHVTERINQLEEEIQAGWDKINVPCGDALDKLWQDIMPEGYGDWEYPGQAYRHLKAEIEKRIKEAKDEG